MSIRSTHSDARSNSVAGVGQQDWSVEHHRQQQYTQGGHPHHHHSSPPPPPSPASSFDAEVYKYALRVAIFQHVVKARSAYNDAKAKQAAAEAAATAASSAQNKREALRRTATEATTTSSPSSSSSITAWSSSFSITDLFKSSSTSSNSSPKYPERFVRVFEGKIEDISRGYDRQYTEMLLRYTVGAYYGKIKEEKNKKLLLTSRKLEDLLLLFITTSTETLKKRCQPGDEWKIKLEEQVFTFLRIVEDCLRNRDVRHVPPELFTKLEGLKAKMSSSVRPLSNVSTAATATPQGAVSSSLDTYPTAASMSPTTSSSASFTVSFDLADMPVARQLGTAFGIDEYSLQEDINAQKDLCTEKAALTDLKTCINLISSNAPFPGCRDDFPSEEAYKEWRGTELKSLQQMMLETIRTFPELVKSGSLDLHGNSGASSGNRLSVDAGTKLSSNGLATNTSEAYVGNRLSQKTLTPIADQYASSSSALHSPNPSLRASIDLSPSSSMMQDHLTSPIPPDSSFTLIPPQPKRAYRRLLEILLSYDLAQMADLDPTEEVSLRILSLQHQELLEECTVRWRTMGSYECWTFLDDMARRFKEGEMPVVECIVEALSDFDKVNESWSHDHWPIEDRQNYISTLSSLFDSLLRSFYETVSEQHYNMSHPDSIKSVTDAINVLRSNPLSREAILEDDLRERLDQLKDGIRRVFEFLYDTEKSLILASFEEMRRQRRGLASSHSGQQRPPSPLQGPQTAEDVSIVPMLDLLTWIKTTAKRLDRHYSRPLLGQVDIPQLFLENVPDRFLADLTHHFAIITEFAQAHKPPLYTTPASPTTPEGHGQRSDSEPITDAEVMQIYRGVWELIDMHNAFCPNKPLKNSGTAQFAPYILKWLAETDKKTLGWVRNAINLDSFSADDAAEGDGHTSSIVDLIASCKGALQFVTDLDWRDEYQNALFLTRLSATVSKAIEEYCIAIEELFMRELTPPKRDDDLERDERRSAWLTRAKALVQEKKLDAFEFKPTSMVKLNNIHAARDLLDKMYTAVDADKVASLTRANPSTSLAKQAQLTHSRNLFTVKIVLGEGLATADGVSRVDPFVTLSDERGLRIAKTRTLYETTEPRWAETFDISVEGKMWIAATVWDRNLVDQHEMLGRTYLALDPSPGSIFNDFLPHDLWKDLDTTGRLLLRVSMEGEKDDIQFYFGRAFRSLKRAENDMTRVIVDKISPFIRSCISQASLKSLLKKGGYLNLLNNFDIKDLNKAFDKARLDQVRNLIKSKDPRAPEIPLPPSEQELFNKSLPSGAAPASVKKAPGLTDAEIEEPLGPLLDYLDRCLETFRKYLSEPAWQVVMTKIWKEVLTVTENLLVPALSDQPTEMKPLSDKEVDIVFKWLKFLTDFFYADGKGVPSEDLRNPRYRAITMIRLYYDYSTDDLMTESVRLTNAQLTNPVNTKAVARSKSVYQQRNLGTIRQRKQEKNEEADSGAAEMVMRILRMRPGALDFVQQQMATLTAVQERAHKPTRLLGSIRAPKGGGRTAAAAARRVIGHRLNTSTSRLPPIPPQPPQSQWKQYR